MIGHQNDRLENSPSTRSRSLHRTTSPDNTFTYLVSLYGMVREMKSLQTVAVYFSKIGASL